MAENTTEGTQVSKTIIETTGTQASPGGLYERIHGRKPGVEPTVNREVKPEWVRRAEAGELPVKASQPPTGDKIPKKVWGED